MGYLGELLRPRPPELNPAKFKLEVKTPQKLEPRKVRTPQKLSYEVSQLRDSTLWVYSLGAYRLGAYTLPATRFGSVSALTRPRLGAYTLGLQSGSLHAGSLHSARNQIWICTSAHPPLRKDIEDPST